MAVRPGCSFRRSCVVRSRGLLARHDSIHVLKAIAQTCHTSADRHVQAFVSGFELRLLDLTPNTFGKVYRRRLWCVGQEQNNFFLP